MGEWISVKDRLPGEDGKYLVFRKIPEFLETVDIAYYCEDLSVIDEPRLKDCHYFGWSDLEGGFEHVESSGVTHWMPLPPPPET